MFDGRALAGKILRRCMIKPFRDGRVRHKFQAKTNRLQDRSGEVVDG